VQEQLLTPSGACQATMGFRCDICEAQEANVFCFNDNAVMCEQCDVRCGAWACRPRDVSMFRQSGFAPLP